MKINIKGIKGYLLRWLLPVLLEYFSDMIAKMSGSMQHELIVKALEFKKHCDTTTNGFDDIIADAILEILDHY